MNSLDTISVCGQQVFINGLSLHWALYFFCLMSKNKKQRQNISTRTAVNSCKLIDRSLTNGAALINLPSESPLFGRSDKLVRDQFETKEPVYNEL